jgi:nucleoside-diphosphate-sugar epimerase
MRILIIGGTGSLSSAVTSEALKQNIEVFMINRGTKMEFIPIGAHLLKSDIRDKYHIEKLINGMHFDAVIDFICYRPEQIKNSFDLFKSHAGQYIFISSCIVYNIRLNNRLYDENSPRIISEWALNVNKNLCEDFLRSESGKNNINYTIIRPATNYGNTIIPNGGGGGEHLFILNRILKNMPLITWNKGENRINVMHVNDFAVGVIGLLGNEQAYNEDFNIAGDETPSRTEILKTLSEILDKEIKTVDIPVKFFTNEMQSSHEKELLLYWHSMSLKFSNQKIKSVVPNFGQTISLKDGLTMTFDSFKKNDYFEGKWYQYDGNQDRIIAEYTKNNHISIVDSNLHFIDYSNKGDKKDKANYIISRTFAPRIIRYITLPKRIIRKFFRSVVKLCNKRVRLGLIE